MNNYPLMLTSAILITGFSFSVIAADPAFTTRAYNETNESNASGNALNIGGDSVTSGGEWALILQTETCALNIYRQDQETLAWEFAQEIVEAPQGGCAGTGFGLSSSLSGDVLVVSAPLFNAGRWFLYEYDGSSWVKEVNFRASSIAKTKGDQYGFSISVSQNPGTEKYLIAIGAPGYDESPNVNSGLVELYTYTSGVGLEKDPDQVIYGSENEELFGFSVTTNFPYALIGAPGATGQGPGGAPFAGKGDIYRLSPFELVDTLQVPTLSRGLGQEVSLSDELALISGSPPFFSAQAWGNDGSADVPIWTLATNTFITNGGDVSQSMGVAAFANRESGGANDGSVNMYRDAINDDIGNDRILVDVNVEYPADDLTDIGLDIRLNRESLWLGNATWDAPGGTGNEGQAIVYQYPCSFGTKMVAFEWQIIGIPCTPTNATVDDVFGHLTGAWEVWGIDEASADLTVSQPATLLAGTDVLDQNRAYWVITDTDQYFTISNTVNPIVTPATVDISNVSPTSADRSRPRIIPDPDTPSGGGTAFGRILVANPFSRSFAWEDLRFVQGTYKTLAQAEADREILATGYVYDLDSVNGSGQNYRAVTATPGFDNEIQPFQGFWIRILENHPSSEALMIPRPR